MSHIMKLVRMATIFCIVLKALSLDASAEIYHWLQYGPNGLEARAITDQPNCPSAEVDGTQKTMVVRAAPDPQYAVTACVLPIPVGARSAAIADVPLPLPGAEPRRIAVIGEIEKTFKWLEHAYFTRDQGNALLLPFSHHFTAVHGDPRCVNPKLSPDQNPRRARQIQRPSLPSGCRVQRGRCRCFHLVAQIRRG